ncbi:bifunctional diaminohydroxyphosphoribosylaminopyrimidine deaminase/5-amino-6-(5-phosphoribosylamino)uracil reductase RibD [Rhodobacter sp. Har01]|uniref:bifunctional diaminohydroxyphosphoribosylaminopyrimidine deaminase/5-amino-6-(5-phosphoribosylamino)uracil reductase RibD n=1 Tax=Rhodobacter sp. Har01 TaxID=2883999 RepID=UPI001D072F5E|nr:bifunctional diaminohydroxyphosphoribosylaminopyrimidine deaminase/5-amino-6-(5-phosphoribosylamino)uracil reductase RibD [Rhodobacter sp. Har01]MCB6178883.1 bifunctional diaminohydroxyphosphoribosylaminopyrimidine deaminase/5-amino-6-(5-phosphoribosylamino)uracil reductase RibD [Rhodobacter sp. Har01]
MAHALRLAARGLGATWPNPSVGCVIVKDGVVLGRGTTAPGGRPHAERVALAQAGAAAAGATAYVTLEPCAHHGQTPPCAEALVAARLARVVTALTDPDPRTAGQGHALLRKAGIAVTEGVLSDPAARVAAGFVKRVTRGLPFVTLKLATTLDGRIATATGESRWITGAQARAHGHLLRLSHDAVLVGSGTARADDPDLTIRAFGTARQPLRVVLDSRLSHRPDSRLGQTARLLPVWLLHGPAAAPEARAAWSATGARLIECPAVGDHLDLAAAFRRLAKEGLTRVLCEGGGTLAAALTRAGLVDALALYQAGCLIGADGTPALGPLGLSLLQDAPRLRLGETRTLGPDTFSLWFS